jgi:hypothetical protein
MDAVCLDEAIQQIKDARPAPMCIALNILMTGIHIYWCHQIIYVTCSFAVFATNAGKEKSAVLQGFC